MTERVNVDSARSDDQREVLETIVDDGVCPFCVASLARYHKKPIIAQGEHWTVTTNQWPYKYTQAHYLLIARAHIETVTEVPDGAFEELGGHVKDLVRTTNMKYGGLAMRFGDITNNGASVNHLHAHVLQAAEDIPDGEKVKFKFSR